MFNRDKKTLLVLAVLALLLNPSILFAAEANIVSVGTEVLPINTAQAGDETAVAAEEASNTLVSPSKPSEDGASEEVSLVVPTEQEVSKDIEKDIPTVTEEKNPEVMNSASETAEASAPQVTPPASEVPADDFDFDLKMKSIGAPVTSAAEALSAAASPDNSDTPLLTDEDLPKVVQYRSNPIEKLGNNILSQMDDDLFSQMSEIEKSTTLLTLELRREKIRNEIEAQKAIRQKAFDDLERQKAEMKLKELEKEKQIEAQVLKEQQVVLDKQQLLEVLKQRKLLNAYMNHMLVSQQQWLKEKKALYDRLAMMEEEKKELTELFKQKIEKLVEASAQNMQAAEAAKANFDRVVKSLKARNEQLRKRIEADAKIIKNAQNSLYLKSQSLEELQNKNAELAGNIAEANAVAAKVISTDDELSEESEALPVKLSSQFAIMGIIGRSDTLAIEVIDVNGQPMSLKIGSSLPTGHVLKEIGSDYAMFTRDGINEYLYVGRTIDGFIPTLGLVTTGK